MYIEFTDHAKFIMNERGAEEDDIEYILRYPDYIKKSFAERLIAVGKWNKKPIKIVYVKQENYIRVLTII